MISRITPLLLFLSLVFGQAQININNLVERGGKLFKINDDIPYSGLAFSLYDGGEKHIEGTYKDGKQDGLWTYWYDSGQKKGEENYKDGKRDGLWISWYSNGQKKFEDNYKDGRVEGKWIWWDENGEKREEITYKNGNRIEESAIIIDKRLAIEAKSEEESKRKEAFYLFTPPGMVYVAGGTFQMGSNNGESDEKPIHTVTVSSFYMDQTEVTQAEYRKVMGKNPSSFSGCDACPVEQVRWYDANEYAKKVGKRLPTEAEWEYAARGGNKSKGYTYSGSNNPDAAGWYDNNSRSKTHPVAQKQPNELGLYDMSGNVWEWCSDWYDKGYYSGSPQTDPQGSNSGEDRVLRGGSWNNNDNSCQVANRSGSNPDYRSSYRGFRLVLSQD